MSLSSCGHLPSRKGAMLLSADSKHVEKIFEQGSDIDASMWKGKML